MTTTTTAKPNRWAQRIEALVNGATEYDHALRVLTALAEALDDESFGADRLIDAYNAMLKDADPTISNGADWLEKLAEQADQTADDAFDPMRFDVDLDTALDRLFALLNNCTTPGTTARFSTEDVAARIGWSRPLLHRLMTLVSADSRCGLRKARECYGENPAEWTYKNPYALGAPTDPASPSDCPF